MNQLHRAITMAVYWKLENLGRREVMVNEVANVCDDLGIDVPESSLRAIAAEVTERRYGPGVQA